MPATATGRGAQVILDGDAQAAARGAYAPTYTGNSETMAGLVAQGSVASGNTADGTTSIGLPANDFVTFTETPAVLTANAVPYANTLAVVGDSISAISRTSSGLSITASGGTAPYTFSVSGLPTGSTANTASPLLWISNSTAAAGTYTLVVTATDNAAATGQRSYTYTVDGNGQMTLAASGASSGAVTLSDLTNRNINEIPRGASFWAPVLTDRRVVSPLDLNFGVSGDMTSNVLARMAPILTANCGAYFVMIGTNDLAAGVAVATIQANILSIWRQLLATGRIVIASTILPRDKNGVYPISQAALDRLYYLNRWIRSQRGTMPGLYVVDGSQYGDPSLTTGAPKSGVSTAYDYSLDGVHPKALGSYTFSTPLAALLTQLYPAQGPSLAGNSDVYSTNNPTGNLLPNGMLTGTGGTVSGRVTGTAPTSWSILNADNGASPATYTCVGSAGTLADGTPAAVLTLGGTAKGGFATIIYLNCDITSFTNYAAGDKLQAVARFEMSGAAGVSPPYIRLTYTSGGISHQLMSGMANYATFEPGDAGYTGAYSGTLATPLPAPILPGVPTGTLRVQIGVLIVNDVSQTIGGVLKIGAVALRKV